MNDFYGVGMFDVKILDRSLYRGRGRPRKIDYSPLKVIQEKINVMSNKYMNRRMKNV